MSNTIDRRVVEMRFDNQQFESRTKTTLGTLEKLKNALNFSHASDGLDKLNKSVGNMNMNPLRSAVDGVQVSFSKMEAMALTALTNITNRAVDAGIALAKNLTIDQLSAGWQKYADKTTAVQTIMAATKNQFSDTAEQMEFVNDQLDKLNWFTDETSYNFVDMVSNIGKFTSANVALDDSVTAMEGIATWAAVSGQNATVASRAMYQLSQALGAGAVKLMDWRSIENANMNTYEFKETALETAVSLGILQKEADGVYKTVEDGTKITNEGFRESLQLGWFTSDVLMKTLERYGGFTDKIHEVSDATGMSATELLQLMDRYREAGDSASEMLSEVAKANKIDVEELQQYMEQLTDDVYELGEKAFRAGQEAKTFQEAVDSVKDAVSTGWMNTFEIIFGDYEEARVRWTALANELWDIFASGAEARNELLEEALGLPDAVVQRQVSGWAAVEKAVEAAGIPLDDFIQKCLELGGKDGAGINSIEDFKNSLTEGWLTKDIVSEAIDSFIGPIEQVGDTTEKVGHTFEDFKRIVDETWNGNWSNWVPRWKQYTEAGWNWEAMQNAVNKSGQQLELTYEDYQAALASCSDEQLKYLGYTEQEIEAIRETTGVYGEFDDVIYDVTSSVGELRTGSELLFGGISQGWDAIKGIFSAMKRGWDIAFPSITPERLYNILAAFNDVTSRFDEWVGNWDDSEGTPISKTVQNIADTFAGLGSILGIALDALKEVTKFLRDTFAPSIGSGIDSVLEYSGSIGRTLVQLREWIQETGIIRRALDKFASVIRSVISALGAWLDKFKQLPSVQKWTSKATEAWGNLVEMIEGLFPKAAAKVEILIDAIRDIWENKDFSNATEAIQQFASALGEDLTAAWESLKSSGLFGQFASGIEAIWKAIKNLDPSVLPEWAKSAYDALKGFLDPALDILSTIKDRLVNYGNQINGGFKTIGDVLADAAEYLYEHIGSIIAVFALFIGARSIVRFINTLVGIAKAVTAPVQTIVSAFSSFTAAAKGFSKAMKGLALMESAAAIAGLAFVAVELGTVPQEQLYKGIFALGLITVFVIGVIEFVSRLYESKSKLNASFVKGQVSGMFKMLELAGAVALLAKSFDTVVKAIRSTSTTKTLTQALIGIIGAVGVLFTLSILITRLGGKYTGKGLTIPILAISASIYILVESFKNILDALYLVPEFRIDKAEQILLDLTATVGLIAVLLAAVGKIPTYGSSVKMGASILTVSAAVKLLVNAFSDILEMELDNWDMGKTVVIVGIIAAIGGIMLALSKMPKSAGINGIGLFAAAASIEVLALAIRTMASISPGDIAKGVIAIGAMMTFMELFVLLTRKGSELTAKSAVVFIGLSAAILILSGAIAVLSLLRAEDVLLGVTAISAMITAVGVMMFLSSIAGDLDMKHFLGLSIVISVLSGAIIAMSFLDPNAVLMGTVAISAMLTACGIMMLLMSAAKGLSVAPFAGLVLVIGAITGAVWALSAIDPVRVLSATAALSFVMGTFTVMSTILSFVTKSISKQGPMAIAALAMLSLVLISIAAVIAFLSNSIEDPSVAMTVSLALSALFFSLGKVLPGVAALGKLKFTEMLKGLAGVVLVLTAVGGLSAALGLLNEKVPALQDAIQKGFPVLRTIGQAIGEVFGGILEGLFKIDISNLIAQLVVFAQGVQKFSKAITGASFDSGTAEAVRAIGATLIYLAGADLISSITKLFGGDRSSLNAFSKDLPGFATALKQFSEKLGTNFNASSVSAAATAAKDLTKMVNSLPTSGGWKAKILGDRQSLGDFGDSIITFADDLKTFCGKISDDTIDPDKISTVATAASSLVDLINNLPAKDGWLQKIIGQPQDLGTFASGMDAFATSIKTICGTGDGGLGDITEDKVKCIEVAATAAWKLRDLEDALPDEEGWFGKIFGGKQDFEGFGDQIKKFGAALKTAVSADGFGGLQEGDKGYVQIAVDIADQLKGLVSDEFDENKLKDLGKAIEDFGEYIYNFNADVSTISAVNLYSIVHSINDLIDGLTSATMVDSSMLNSFSTALSNLALTGINNFCSAFTNARPQVIIAVHDFLTASTNAMGTGNDTFKTKGQEASTAFINSFNDFKQKALAVSSAKSVITTMIGVFEGNEFKFSEEGENSVKKYIKEFQNQYSSSKTAGVTLASNVLTGLSSNAQKFRTSGINAASSYVSAISSYSRYAYNAASSLASSASSALSGSYSTTRSLGQNFAIGFINGMSGWMTNAYNVAYNIGRSAVNGLRRAIDAHSPSREAGASADDFGIGFVVNMLHWVSKAGDAAKELGEETVLQLNQAIAKIPDILSSGMDFDPVIRPVVDLTNAQQSVAALNGMFNQSIGVAADIASVTGSAVATAKVRTMSADQPIKTDETSSVERTAPIYNTFNITSNNPEEVASVVSRRIQKQMERKEASWAQLSGTGSPLVRSR